MCLPAYDMEKAFNHMLRSPDAVEYDYEQTDKNLETKTVQTPKRYKHFCLQREIFKMAAI